MPLDEVYRFHGYAAAAMVLKEARKLLPANSLHIERRPCTDTRQDPAGNFVIVADNVEDGWAMDALRRTVDLAIQMALADALRLVQPKHPLLSVWYLRPEHRQKVAV